MRHGLHRPLRAAGNAAPALIPLLALVLAWGCGGEKTPSKPPIPSIEIRNGLWQVQQTVTFSGHDSCIARGTLQADTSMVLCNVDVVDPGFVDADVTCPSFDKNGDAVSYVCRVRVDLGVCYQIVEITGAGTVSDTAFNLQNTFYTRFEPVNPDNQIDCELLFGKTVDACTTSVVSIGTWVFPDTGEVCPADPSAAGIPLERFVTGEALSGVLQP